MKTFLMALSATALIASPLVASEAQAAPQHREMTRVVQQGPHGRTIVQQRTVTRGYNNGQRYGYNNQRGYTNPSHRWAKGQRFDSRYATNYRVINNYRDYRLNAPPRGYHYVRSGNDAVLVAITSGIIGAVIGSALN